MDTPKKIGIAVMASAAVIAAAVALIKPNEGLVLKTSPDPIGIPTYCYGETQHARLGQIYTKGQCDAQLEKEVREYDVRIVKCIHRPMTDNFHVAAIDFAWNLGTGAFCGGSVARQFNAGNLRAACEALLPYNKGRLRGKLVVLPGLVKRRKQEYALCMKDA